MTDGPAYPHIVVALDGEKHEVYNRVMNALRAHDVPEQRRALYSVAAVMTNDPAGVARKWVTEETTGTSIQIRITIEVLQEGEEREA